MITIAFRSAASRRFAASVLVLGLTGFQAGAASAQSGDNEPVRIALLPESQVANSLVTFKDLANVSGGTPRMRERINQLDLVEFTAEEQTEQITQRELMARLLLAGYDRNEFTISGANQSLVSRLPAQQLEQKVRDSLVKKISKSFNVGVNEIDVQLLDTVPPLDAIHSHQGIELAVLPLVDPDSLLGSRSIEFGLMNGNHLIKRFRLRVATSIYQEVTFTSEPIALGDEINSHNSYVERVRVDQLRDVAPSFEDINGQFARRAIRAQQIIREPDITDRATAAAQKPVVKVGDVVTIVAQKRGLKITLAGAQVMRAGKIGDMIPLKNPNSKKVIYGTVKSSSEVEVQF